MLSHHALRARTFAVYTPLIDIVPSDPTTMMTGMVEAQRLTHLTGQNITVFTNDQQLYRVAVNIAWVYPDLFHYFIPRLGGMHILMNFVGAIGHLIENSGLEEVLKSAFCWYTSYAVREKVSSKYLGTKTCSTSGYYYA